MDGSLGIGALVLAVPTLGAFLGAALATRLRPRDAWRDPGGLRLPLAEALSVLGAIGGFVAVALVSVVYGG